MSQQAITQGRQIEELGSRQGRFRWARLRRQVIIGGGLMLSRVGLEAADLYLSLELPQADDRCLD